jgi:hypothetical protein
MDGIGRRCSAALRRPVLLISGYAPESLARALPHARSGQAVRTAGLLARVRAVLDEGRRSESARNVSERIV